MSTLYVGNNTKHRLVLHYRLHDFKPDQRSVPFMIPMGGQERVPHDLTSEDIDFVLEQWRHFKPIDMASMDRTKGAAEITYRIEKPITQASLEAGVEKNTAAAVDRSVKVFAENGVALATTIAKRAAEEGNALERVRLSVQEDFIGDKPKNVVARGVEVTPRGARTV